jgi:hypothetical protein
MNKYTLMWYVILVIACMVLALIIIISIYVVYFLPGIMKEREKIN